MTNDSDKDLLKTGGAFDVLSEVSANEQIVGRDLGDYRVSGLIAEGGMSRVYRAERIDGSFEREVAIKVSPVSGFNEQMRERFLMEQGVLAGLNHPNISQLYDAQVTAEGWPYIVMELVDGGAIDEFCKSSIKETDERIGLLIEVVDAVAFAHARLVVHRDIKPSNVLVDAEGRPKLLDFGIAKLLEGDADDLTKMSPMTPRYASPEQLLGQPVTVASDIYQLGLLIYEVLTGEPLNQDDGPAVGIERAAQKMSLNVGADMRRRLPKELVQVIEQCLRVDPDERYRDTNSLRRDLVAYLDGYPVSAAGQSAGYRFRKFVGRNLAASFISIAAVVTIIGSAAWYTNQITAQRNEAERQSAMATEALDFLTGIFSSADPNVTQDRDTTVLEVLESGAKRIESELQDQPAIRARLQNAISHVFAQLGEKARAVPLAEKAVESTRLAYGAESLEFIESQNGLAEALYATGRFQECHDLLEELVDSSATVLGPMHLQTIRARSTLANSIWGLGDPDTFASMTEETYQMSLESLGQRHEQTHNLAYSLAIAYVGKGMHAEAIALSERTIPEAEELSGKAHSNTVSLMSILATAYNYVGRQEDEVSLREQIVPRVISTVGEVHPRTATEKANLALAYIDIGQTEIVESLLSDAIAVLTQTLGTDHPATFYNRANLAIFQARYDTNPDAAVELERIIEEQSEIIGPEHPDTVVSRLYRVETLARQDLDAAESEIIEVTELANRVLGEDNPLLGQFNSEIDRIRGQ